MKRPKDCGQAGLVEAVYDALRAQFGLSPSQARCKLNTLKQAVATTL